MDKVIIGVDPDKLSATIEVVDRDKKSLRAGQSLLKPLLATVSGGPQTGKRATPKRVGNSIESIPPGTWIESGRTPILLGSL